MLGVANGLKRGIVTTLKGKENMQLASKRVGCFICQDPYRAKNYPNREKVSAIKQKVIKNRENWRHD